jgi:hypothetical protein
MRLASRDKARKLTAEKQPPFDVVDPCGLTDADWTEINKLRRAYDAGGQKALTRAYRELGKDPVRYIRVMKAIHPVEVLAAIKDAVAKRGLTEQDIMKAVKSRASRFRDP